MGKPAWCPLTYLYPGMEFPWKAGRVDARTRPGEADSSYPATLESKRWDTKVCAKDTSPCFCRYLRSAALIRTLWLNYSLGTSFLTFNLRCKYEHKMQRLQFSEILCSTWSHGAFLPCHSGPGMLSGRCYHGEPLSTWRSLREEGGCQCPGNWQVVTFHPGPSQTSGSVCAVFFLHWISIIW